MINLMILLKHHGDYNRNCNPPSFAICNKRIITGQPRANVRVHVPGVIVQVDGAGAAVNPIVPVAAFTSITLCR
jgi:hypothetical protein